MPDLNAQIMLSQHWNEREALQEGYRIITFLMSLTDREYAFIKRDLHPPEAYIALLRGSNLYSPACVYIYVTDDQLRSLIQDADEDLMHTFRQGHPVFVPPNNDPYTPLALLEYAIEQLKDKHYTVILCELMNENTESLLATQRTPADMKIAQRVVRGCANKRGPAIIAQVGANDFLTSVDMRNIILPSPNL
ncbi:hypothetical protein [Methylorubrum sp. SL192]|uniref:hypothetical protein n=1 Tax=Methylorubrum sp. SL192 TaxID=2995167 RepID=UPI0022727AF3|nr:hypothetical protein [Methylorubrum sp. SL192]MCY1644086.1 hypothetical protein [Methylorubrum sp. SL192]